MKIFIRRDEEEWQILDIFRSLEEAIDDAEEKQDIPKGSWNGPEQIHDTQWWTSDEHGPNSYIICYEV